MAITQTSQTESWENLTLANNFLFCKIMESEPELCRQLLELLLHIKIDHLEVPQAEKSMKETLDSKSVRFDVYTKDDNRIFDIEMQTTNKENLPKRARYYQSIIDMSNLNAGTEYDELKDTYIIFICLQDIFHKGLPVYTFENVCLEDKKTKLNDRAFKLFFNASNYDKLASEDEKSFFKFLRGEDAETDFTKNLKDKLSIAKKNAEWRIQYMTWEQTIKHERKVAFRDGLQQGAQAKAIENAENLLKMNILTAEQIAQGTGLSLENILALQEHCNIANEVVNASMA